MGFQELCLLCYETQWLRHSQVERVAQSLLWQQAAAGARASCRAESPLSGVLQIELEPPPWNLSLLLGLLGGGCYLTVLASQMKTCNMYYLILVIKQIMFNNLS